MKHFVLSIVLIFIGAIPIGISVFNYLIGGGLQWPMIWLNEATTWGCIFSVFPIAGVFISYVNKRLNRYAFYILLLLALIIVFPSYYNLAVKGIGQSSKQDSTTLNLMGYWSSRWWE